MTENQPFSIADSIREARQRLALELHAQAEQIQKLNLEVAELQLRHDRTEQEASRQWDEVTRAAEQAVEAAAALEPAVAPDTVLENVLGAVRALMTCTIPDQVFETLTEEASEWGVRAAIFDVRGRAAWGASAHGFGPALSEKVFQTLVVQLNQDNPFRQVCEIAGPVEASTATLKKNRNVLDKLKPAPQAPILLLPIRSAGTVSAIFYADPGEEGQPLPVNALKILAEFAGAQIDRLIALSGGVPEEEVKKEEVVKAAANEPPVEEAPVEVVAEEPAPAQPPVGEPAVEPPVVEGPVAEAHAEVEAVEPPVTEPEPPVPPAEVVVEAPPSPAEVVVEPPPPAPEVIVEAPPPAEIAVEAPAAAAPVVESEPAPPIVEAPVEVIPPPPPIEPPPSVAIVESAPPTAPAAPAVFDVTQLSEAEQKVHKDAKRFAKLLVSEIELYNKAKVTDGRKNHDLYKRLKSDIDRSRQTFQKRFGKTLSKQVDYFHDELVKNLAADDSSILGPEYPGPSA